jgi:hypothetical protein
VDGHEIREKKLLLLLLLPIVVVVAISRQMGFYHPSKLCNID